MKQRGISQERKNWLKPLGIKTPLLFGLFFSLLIIGLSLPQVSVAASTVSFTITPTSQSGNSGQIRYVNINFITNDQNVTTGGVSLTMDSGLLSYSSFKPSSNNDYTVSNQKAGANTLTFDFASKNAKGSKQNATLGVLAVSLANVAVSATGKISFVSGTKAVNGNTAYQVQTAEATIVVSRLANTPPPKTDSSTTSSDTTQDPSTPTDNSATPPIETTTSQKTATKKLSTRTLALIIGAAGAILLFMVGFILFKSRRKKSRAGSVDPTTGLPIGGFGNPSNNFMTTPSVPAAGYPSQPSTPASVPWTPSLSPADIVAQTALTHLASPTAPLQSAYGATTPATVSTQPPLQTFPQLPVKRTTPKPDDQPDMFELAEKYPGSYGSARLAQAEEHNRQETNDNPQ